MSVLGGVAGKWRDVGREFYIPDATLSVIDADFTSDLERLRGVIVYSLLKDPYASWRRLIRGFDRSGDDDLKQVADYQKLGRNH